ncbi:tubulin-binding prefolding complex subunit [Saccharomycopsis crataegensis]|uniref:Prefoldin subunit 3 n=1 Tax=Saccharomycopsis crataegensis TaxID=43959 RepID=A0AAV5QFD3_9ASCO|nr:tubulin-binding prefolding complex subunit [Saccharomycopsis crataegensis]
MADILDKVTDKNPRGIPQAPFVSKVEDLIKVPTDFEPVMQKFQERLQQYKFMEQSKQSAIASYKAKIPDIEKSLSMVEYLREKQQESESIHTNYELNDTLYSQAIIEPTDKVCLWLGADVMMEYPLAEAIDLLSKKLKTVKENLNIAEEDSMFLRENITTMEVNTARLYNWNVKQKKLLKDQAAK